MPQISVIVPTYNTAKYLPRCLDSILNQTFQDFELIIVSDGPDADDNIADEYARKDHRIKVLKGINKGLGGARNAGMEIAQGEYIAFIDSDDKVEPTMLEKTIKVYKNNDVDLVVFDTEFDNNCKITKKRIGEEIYISLKYDGLVQVNSDVIFNTNVHAWNKLWKKEIIDKYNIKFPENVCFEDFPFYFKYVFMIKKSYYLKEKLYIYNRRDDSLMAETYNHKRFEQNKVHITSCEFLYKELKELNLYEQCEGLFITLFEKWVGTALFHSKKFDRKKIKKLACKMIEKLDLDISQSAYLTRMREKHKNHLLLSFFRKICLGRVDYEVKSNDT